MPEGPPRVYKGTFATGHTPMVGTTAIQFSENAMHEFIEDYKSAHGLKEKKGPGLAKVYEFRAQPRREAPPLPMTGTRLEKLMTGNKPARKARTSSQAVGGWWDDELFQQLYNKVEAKGKGPVPASQGISTASQVGQFWHDPILEDNDIEMAKARAKNGIRRLLPVEMNSSFALEDIPTQHRLL